ncbi:MAG: hypothetical protein D6762_05790, partial [Candidatus Neomarinimicrobiota bacterium]
GQNIDIIGDVPTGCDSDYLITVTNTTKYDTKNAGAGYGLTTIDLGAPGTGILSLSSSGATGTSTGTSMASPHVAGAVAFLHSIVTAGFAQFYKTHPAEGALMVKNWILAGVDSIPDLANTTVSGGRLNLYNSTLLALNVMGSDSTDPNPVTDLAADTSHWYQVTLTWTDPTTTFGGDTLPAFVIDVYRDDSLRGTVPSGVEFYHEGQLTGGQTYRYSLITRLVESHAVSIPAILTVTVSGGDCLAGDVSLDGRVDLLDVITEMQFILGFRPPDPSITCQADVDFDNEITVYDLLGIADRLNSR